MMWFIQKNKKAIIPLTAGLVFLGCFLAGCKEEASQKKPVVVKKSIQQPSETAKPVTAEKATPAADGAAAPAATQIAKVAPEAKVPETAAAPAAGTAPAEGPGSAEVGTAAPQTNAGEAMKPDAEKAATSDEAPAPKSDAMQADSEAPAVEEVEAAAATQEAGAEEKSLVSSLLDDTFPKYESTGKVDPFSALFSEESEADTAENSEPTRPLTPLERIDISQLKLVAVLLAQSGNRAMVEDATGKPYILTPGTYIGINSGIVKQILKDRVVVEEKTKDFLGRQSTDTRELKLQKPFGEE